MNVIISVIGKDRIGIIADVCQLLAGMQVNIVDISQTIMGEYFTMIMRANVAAANIRVDEMVVILRDKGEELGLGIDLRSEEIFNAMHRI